MPRLPILVCCIALAGWPAAAGDHEAERSAALPGPAADIPPEPEPVLAIGDSVDAEAALRSYFPGMDLTPLDDAAGYYRTDEHVYLVDRMSGEILEVILIADVILR